jgi:ABC-type spermidine/putrescine transport system permease subunit II
VRALALALEQVRALAPKSTPTRRKGKAGADFAANYSVFWPPVVFGIGILLFVFYRQEDLDLC